MTSRHGRAVIGIIGIIALAAVVAPTRLLSQGTISTQGLGYPPGQLSTFARTMGGASGETDPLSALNPAALGLLPSAVLSFQVEPEYRTLRIGSQSVSTSLSRFPLFMAALPLGGRWTVGLSVSTLLDRTFETSIRDTQTVSGEDVYATVLERSEGSITDIRLGLSYALTPWLRVGLGGHALSGSDALMTLRTFDDTVRFARDSQRTVVGFGGNAVTAGAHMIFPRKAAIGLTYRRGLPITAYNGNTPVGEGRAPDHLGVSLVYLGIRGTALAVRAARDEWSSLDGMASTLNIHEGWDIGAGADVTGPRFGGSAIGLRAGVRWRTLPFSVNADPVDEFTWSGGFALPMGRVIGPNRAVELQVGILRSSRSQLLQSGTETFTASEKSWTMTTGFVVRP